jgi:hypothetical protein
MNFVWIVVWIDVLIRARIGVLCAAASPIWGREDFAQRAIWQGFARLNAFRRDVRRLRVCDTTSGASRPARSFHLPYAWMKAKK